MQPHIPRPPLPREFYRCPNHGTILAADTFEELENEQFVKRCGSCRSKVTRIKKEEA
jgi:hypothetical protein